MDNRVKATVLAFVDAFWMAGMAILDAEHIAVPRKEADEVLQLLIMKYLELFSSMVPDIKFDPNDVSRAISALVSDWALAQEEKKVMETLGATLMGVEYSGDYNRTERRLYKIAGAAASGGGGKKN